MKLFLTIVLALVPAFAGASSASKPFDECSDSCKHAYATEVSGIKPHIKEEVCVEAPYRRPDKVRLTLLRADGSLARDPVYRLVKPAGKHVTYETAPRVRICVGAAYAKKAQQLRLCQGWEDGATWIANRSMIEMALSEVKPGKPAVLKGCLLENKCPDYRGALPKR